MPSVRNYLGKLKRFLLGVPPPIAASQDYVVVPHHTAIQTFDSGWDRRHVALTQEAVYQGLLREMYAGRPRVDFVAATSAVRDTGLSQDTLLEVGCGSGYYQDVFEHMLGHPMRYVGLDFSAAMLGVARERKRRGKYILGDAVALPFRDRAFSIVFNGGNLMHVRDYRSAISEGARVARNWCIFHTVPVLQNRETTALTKLAYGGHTSEFVFNEHEIRECFAEAGLVVDRVYDSIEYDLSHVLGETTTTKTYACRVAAMSSL